MACLIDLNDYLAYFPREPFNYKIGVTELKKILLDSMHNSCYRQAYVQGFDYEYITFKKNVNMFERMEIAESIYEGVV